MMEANLTRRIGVVYLVYFIFAIGSVLVGSLVREGYGRTLSVWLAIVSTLIYAFLAVLFYRLFSKVGPSAASGALFVALAGCTVQAYGIVTSTAGVQHAALAFFAAFDLLLGYLIISSRYVPTPFGWILVAAAIGWLAFLVPFVAAHGGAILEALGLLAEVALMLWLLIHRQPVRSP